MKPNVRIAASYRLAILGYGAGMILSMLDHVPAGLVFMATAAAVAGALFSVQARRGQVPDAAR